MFNTYSTSTKRPGSESDQIEVDWYLYGRIAYRIRDSIMFSMIPRIYKFRVASSDKYEKNWNLSIKCQGSSSWDYHCHIGDGPLFFNSKNGLSLSELGKRSPAPEEVTMRDRRVNTALESRRQGGGVGWRVERSIISGTRAKKMGEGRELGSWILGGPCLW